MDYGPLQSNHLKTHQSGTGQWFLDLKELQHWITANNHILFCHGIPGSGKTILTALIINHLSSRFRGGHEVGMAYIYFDYKRVEEQNLEKLLASLLKQLAGSLPYLPESTKELYRQHSITRTRPSLAELITEFEYIISQYSKLFIVLDALDECQSSDLVQFLSKLSNLQKDHVVNILATSRPIPIIVDWFSNVNSTKLEIRSETSDITKYIEGHIGLLPNVAQRNLPLAEEIKVVISEAADGMYVQNFERNVPY
jgi:Cdc6-like AAA superfamily ATPase